MDKKPFMLHLILKGRVHGVGLRAKIYRLTTSLQLTGFVRNLPQDTVEAVVVGPKAKLDQLINDLKSNPGAARFDSIETNFEESLQSFSSFEIKY